MIRYFYILLFFTLLSGLTHAQTNHFRTDWAEFFVDLEKYLTDADKQEGKELFEEFRTSWDSLVFTDEQKDTIIIMSNMLLDKRVRPFPHFGNYLKTILTFHTSMHDLDSYAVWQRYFYKFLSGKSTIAQINSHFEDLMALMNNGVIYASRIMEWTSPESQFVFEVDKELVAVFRQIDLKGDLRGDSTMIYATNGRLLMDSKIWQGENGKVNWLRANYSPDSVYAELRNYTIKLTKSEFDADSVILTDKVHLAEPIMGFLTEKIVRAATGNRARYPHFVGYDQNIEINDIFGFIDYTGGFELEGKRVIAEVHKANAKARIDFKINGEVPFSAEASRFVFDDTEIAANGVHISFKIDTTELWHPGVKLRYDNKKRQLQLLRTGDGMEGSLFYDTYHGMDIDAEVLEWNVDSSVVYFKTFPRVSKGVVMLKSTDYFNREVSEVKGVFPRNPFIMLYEYGSDEFTLQSLAVFLRIPSTQVSHLLIELSYKGYVQYDSKTGEGRFTQRFYSYLQALQNKKDYDVIEMVSGATGSAGYNASLNLNNKELQIFGLQPIPISYRQNLFIQPTNDSIVLKDNRDFNFDGIVSVGAFSFHGKDFTFFYDDFKINLDNVDSLQLVVAYQERLGDGRVRNQYRRVMNVIENIKGDLLIDEPDNKSGKADNPQYPILNSLDTSYVYYDKVVKPVNVYPRDKFYFKVFPYEIDSLSRFTADALQLPGEFYSDSIFPVFRDVNLVIQKDMSLGFNKSSNPEGDALYGGKGLFFNDLILDSRGLVAAGKLEYLNSTTYSDNFNFYPDSMRTHALRFENVMQKEGFQYPQVDSDSVYVQWYPFADSLLANNEAQGYNMSIPFSMYDNAAQLRGTLRLEPAGITASGSMYINKGDVMSENIKYNARTFTADTASFTLEPEAVDEKSSFADSLAFQTNNVYAYVDFDERVGKFRANGGNSYIDFPHNQYICFMDEFVWYMDRKEVSLSSSVADTDSLSLEASGSRFISTRKSQDSLTFVAARSVFDVNKKIIYAEGVEKIDVADATVFTSDGKVEIRQRANLQTLDNTRIKAGNYEMFNATVTIEGRKYFSGSGYLNFIDKEENTQVINLELIAVDDSTTTTYARGQIPKEQEFKLSPEFNYQGRVGLRSENEHLYFTGKFQLNHNCDQLELNPIDRPWVAFQSYVNPLDIYIPLQNINRTNSVYASTLVTNDSTHVYSAFLNELKFWSDNSIIQSDSMLHYSDSLKRFYVASPEKLANMDTVGQMVSLHPKFCSIYSEGDVNFGVDLGQIDIKTSGNLFHDIEKNAMSMEVITSIDFFFANECLEIIANEILRDNQAGAVDISTSVFKKNLSQFIGVKKANKMLDEIAMQGQLDKVPDEFINTISLTSMNLKWNEESRSFRSDGTIGIGFVNGKMINRKVNGHFEIIKKRSGDIFNFYIETDPNTWFFFTYSRNVMKSVSSVGAFNDFISNLKEKDRRLEVERNQAPFSYYLSSDRIKNQFIRRMTIEEEDEDEYDFDFGD